MTRKVRTCYEHSIVTPPLLLRPRSERVRRWSGGQRGILLTSPRHASTRLSQRFDRRVRWQRCDSQTVLSFRFAYILNFPVLKFSAWCWKSWATRLITTHALNLPHISLGYGHPACTLQFVCIPVPVCSHASCMRSPTRAHSAWATNGTMRQACSRGLVVLRLLTRIRYRLHWPTGNNICRFLLCLALELKITSIHW